MRVSYQIDPKAYRIGCPAARLVAQVRRETMFREDGWLAVSPNWAKNRQYARAVPPDRLGLRSRSNALLLSEPSRGFVDAGQEARARLLVRKVEAAGAIVFNLVAPLILNGSSI